MQVLFEHHGKGIVSRNNLEWNKNNFSREFKSTTDAAEFIKKFQALTVFDRVQQVVLTKPVDEQESVQSQRMPANENPNEHETPQDEPEISVEDHPPPAKKQKKTDTFALSNPTTSNDVISYLQVSARQPARRPRAAHITVFSTRWRRFSE